MAFDAKSAKVFHHSTRKEENQSHIYKSKFLSSQNQKKKLLRSIYTSWCHLCMCVCWCMFLCAENLSIRIFHCVYMILNYPKLYKAQNARKKKLFYSFVCEARAYVHLPAISILYTRYAVIMCGLVCVCVCVTLLNTR